MPDTAGPKRIRGWLRRFGVVVVPCALFCAAVVWFFLPTEHPSRLMARIPPAVVLFDVLGIGFSVRAVTHRALDRRSRRPWRVMIVCFLVHLASGVVFGAAKGQGPNEFSSSVMVGYAVHLAAVAVLLAALFTFAAEPLSRRSWLKVAFDVTTVIGGGGMGLWYLLISPVLAEPNRGRLAPLIFLVSVAVSDLILLLGVSIVILRGIAVTARRPVSVLLLGILSYLGLDLFMAFTTSNGQLPPINPVVCVAILLPSFLMAVAAAEQCRLASMRGTANPQQLPFRTHTIMPYLGLAVGFGILGAAAARTGSLFPWAGLVVGAVVMTAGVAARQFVALREVHAMVVTDNLTGLANRLHLKDAMRRAADRSRRNAGPMGILLIDMDGFKQINDTLGHDAGDALLVAFATVLRESVMSSDTPARLGGDEFAVLLDGVDSPEHAVAVAQRILTRAREIVTYYGDTPVAMRASIGVAVANFATDTDMVDEQMLLHRADAAMYAAKRKRTVGWQLFTADMDDGASAPVDPGERALYGPPALQDHEGGLPGEFGDDLDGESELVGSPVDQLPA